MFQQLTDLQVLSGFWTPVPRLLIHTLPATDSNTATTASSDSSNSGKACDIAWQSHERKIICTISVTSVFPQTTLLYKNQTTCYFRFIAITTPALLLTVKQVYFYPIAHEPQFITTTVTIHESLLHAYVWW